MATRLLLTEKGVWKTVSEKAVTNDGRWLRDPWATCSTAERYGWYFGGYFADFVGQEECASLAPVAKGIVQGIYNVENTQWWMRREVRAILHRFTDVHM